MSRCATCGLAHPDRPCFYERLRAALGVLELTAVEDRKLRWLAGWDLETVEAFAGLFERLRASEG